MQAKSFALTPWAESDLEEIGSYTFQNWLSAQVEADLGQGGRFLICKSGTGPLVRVMAEHEDAALMACAVESMVDTFVGAG